MSDIVQLPLDMIEWISSVTNSTFTAASRQAGGGRKQAWLVDLHNSDGSAEHIFLRWDQSPESANIDPWTVRKEAAIYQALRDTPVPVAQFIAMHPTRQAMLCSRVYGRNWFSHIADETEALSTAQDFIGHLAALHCLAVKTLGIDHLDATLTVAEMALAQVDELETIVTARGGEPEPLLVMALPWLRANVPTYCGPAVLVQGDTGPGNFMYADGRVTAIVDWELAHFGDPMDDLAWVSLRSVQEPFTNLDDRFAEYTRLSGHALDADRIRYYRVLAEAKILTMNHGRSLGEVGGGADGGSDVGARLVFGQLHRRLCAEALADVLGCELPSTIDVPLGRQTESEELFDVVLGQLRNVISPRITDSFALQRTKGLARVIKYLAESSRFGESFAADELDDLSAALGERPASVPLGRGLLSVAVRTGRIDDIAALKVIYRQLLRTNELLRGASGALASRHYWPLS